MSADRISSAKRKASEACLDSEEVGFFPHKLKPIFTARPRQPESNQRLLEIKADKPADAEATVNLILPTEQVDVGDVGLVLSTKNVYVGTDSSNLTDGDEGCKTPKSEEHRIPKILTCPRAPRKPRPMPRKRTQSSAALCRALFVDPTQYNFYFFNFIIMTSSCHLSTQIQIPNLNVDIISYPPISCLEK